MDATTTLGDGRYELLEPIGSGGAAEVWRARDTELDVDRAIKILSARAATRSTLRRRLRAEAQVLARLDHPHVLRVLDIGEHEGRPYLVMDLLDGGSISDVVRRDGPLSVERAVTVLLEVLSALAAAHGEGIIHRDIKPQNILLDRGGRAVVADFGIALIEGGERKTRTGVAMGSFAFMPPEQRVDAKRVGPSADLYSAGCTLFWMVTGHNPIDLFAEPPDGDRWTMVPRELVHVVRWATQAEPEDRPASAADLAARLAPLATDEARQRRELDPHHFPTPQPVERTLPVEPQPDETTQVRTTPLDDRTTTLPLAPTPPGAPPAMAHPASGLRADTRTRSRAWLVLTGLVVAAVLLMVLAARESLITAPPAAVAPSAPPELDAALDPSEAPGRTVQRIERPVPAAPEPPPAVDLPRAWTGSFDGDPMSVRLSGPDDALRGTVTVSFEGNAVDTPVTGRWDAARGVLSMRDTVDAPDAGRYEARLQGGRLSGTFQSRAAGPDGVPRAVIPFTLRPEAP